MGTQVSTSRTLSLVIPAYNEENRLPSTLQQAVAFLDSGQYAFELLVVDDGSQDNTASIVHALAAQDDRVKLISQPYNQGKGAAIKRGIEEASGEIIFFSDADLATPIEELPKLLTELELYDIAIGTRSVKREGQSLLRKSGALLVNRFVQIVALPGIQDSQCGFKGFRANVAKSLARTMTIAGFSFDIEILYKARQAGYSIKQIPVIWHDVSGSKVSPIKDGLLLFRETLRIRFRNNTSHLEVPDDSEPDLGEKSNSP